MVAPEVYLIKENDREMFFAHRPLTGLVFMLIGMGFVYFFSFSTLVKEPVARWVFSAGGALFALVGFGAVLWRYELRLDLLGRTYSGRKGFWPNPVPDKPELEIENWKLQSVNLWKTAVQIKSFHLLFTRRL
jgi:hypothetical protein